MLQRLTFSLFVLFVSMLFLCSYAHFVSKSYGDNKIVMGDASTIIVDSGATSPDEIVTEIKTPKDVQKTATDLINAAKIGNWWIFSSIIIMVIMYALKKIGVLTKMGRWKYIALPSLGVLSSLLAAFQGGVSIDGVIAVMTSAMATGKLQELWEHGVLGIEHSLPPLDKQ